MAPGALKKTKRGVKTEQKMAQRNSFDRNKKNVSEFSLNVAKEKLTDDLTFINCIIGTLAEF